MGLYGFDIYDNYNFVYSPETGHYDDLIQELELLGGSVYGLLFKIAVIGCVLAILALGIIWLIYSNKPKEIQPLKKMLIQIIVVFLLVVNLVGIISTFAMIGIDYNINVSTSGYEEWHGGGGHTR